jgi:hypothetical protein
MVTKTISFSLELLDWLEVGIEYGIGIDGAGVRVTGAGLGGWVCWLRTVLDWGLVNLLGWALPVLLYFYYFDYYYNVIVIMYNLNPILICI